MPEAETTGLNTFIKSAEKADTQSALDYTWQDHVLPEVAALKGLHSKNPGNATKAATKPIEVPPAVSPFPSNKMEARAKGPCSAKCASTSFASCQKTPESAECLACDHCVFKHAKPFCDTHDPEHHPCCKKTTRPEQDLCLAEGGQSLPGHQGVTDELKAKAEGECKGACHGTSFEGCKDIPDAPICKACKNCLVSGSGHVVPPLPHTWRHYHFFNGNGHAHDHSHNATANKPSAEIKARVETVCKAVCAGTTFKGCEAHPTGQCNKCKVCIDHTDEESKPQKPPAHLLAKAEANCKPVCANVTFEGCKTHPTKQCHTCNECVDHHTAEEPPAHLLAKAEGECKAVCSRLTFEGCQAHPTSQCNKCKACIDHDDDQKKAEDKKHAADPAPKWAPDRFAAKDHDEKTAAEKKHDATEEENAEAKEHAAEKKPATAVASPSESEERDIAAKIAAAIGKEPIGKEPTVHHPPPAMETKKFPALKKADKGKMVADKQKVVAAHEKAKVATKVAADKKAAAIAHEKAKAKVATKVAADKKAAAIAHEKAKAKVATKVAADKKAAAIAHEKAKVAADEQHLAADKQKVVAAHEKAKVATKVAAVATKVAADKKAAAIAHEKAKVATKVAAVATNVAADKKAAAIAHEKAKVAADEQHLAADKKTAAVARASASRWTKAALHIKAGGPAGAAMDKEILSNMPHHADAPSPHALIPEEAETDPSLPETTRTL